MLLKTDGADDVTRGFPGQVVVGKVVARLVSPKLHLEERPQRRSCRSGHGKCREKSKPPGLTFVPTGAALMYSEDSIKIELVG